jgi:hypothetical protein
VTTSLDLRSRFETFDFHECIGPVIPPAELVVIGAMCARPLPDHIVLGSNRI